ncbi:LytR/AlgR family response regulator transcription factor [Runella zeae]|jgi:DNA-binding LytR/AlgR family response regulator|uniref:LytR/AlgR family response regulator transcription factor n=1 Tax=Runella zeae TaxID=94255 RepID=UPI000410DDE5|nr:LytTR family DNA-binding domain-containing protein [Runella zeae]
MLQPQLLPLPLVEKKSVHRLCLHVGGIVRMMDTQNIMYLQSEVNYTRFFTKDGKAYLEAKTLKHFNGVLEGSDFIRIHKSFLVNKNFIVEMTPEFVELRNGVQLPVSRRKRRALKKNRAITSVFSSFTKMDKWY